MNRVIELNVSPTGNVTIQTKGYAGSKCIGASRFLEQALGLTLTDRKTTEFYQTTTADQHVGQQQ